MDCSAAAILLFEMQTKVYYKYKRQLFLIIGSFHVFNHLF